MVPGTKIALGDKEFVVPPLSLGQLRTGLAGKIEEHDKQVAEGVDYTKLLVIRGEIVIAALRRNYPESEVSDDELWNRLDFKNILDAWRAVLALNGFDAVGEAEAARVDGLPIASLVTTQLSPPLMDGLSEQSTN
jgi:hypothetical protein